MSEKPMLLPFERLKREIFEKRKADTDPKFGCSPEERSAESLLDYGIANINKPRGPTSHQVSAYVQQILKIKKSGHSGTLDPNVTGVLPVALGRGTRVVQALLPAGKEYVCIMHLHSDYKKEKIREVISSFEGKIRQKPPLRSAVKRVERERKIYYINVSEIDGRDVLFTVGCQAGTYIRKLCSDIGKKLGSGAHMAELIRTKAGPFRLDDSSTLQDLSDSFYYFKNEGNDRMLRKCIKPVENAVEHMAKIYVLDSTVDTLCHGAALKVPGISKVESDIAPDDNIAVMTLKNELVAIGKAKMTSRQIIKEEKGIAAVSDSVFMLPGTYPKIEKKEST